MSDRTGHGPLSGRKITQATKITQKTHVVVFVIFVFFVIFVAERVPWAVSRQAPPAGQQPTQAQQRPVFRGGTHFVRVDAYPTMQDGKIVEGLKPEDFEVLEDGKRQAIESFDFISFEGLTPEAERRDPQSQREGFDKAADPRYRLFVVYVDMTLSKSAGAFGPIENLPHIQQPLINFFERIVGPQDLYGFVTTRNSVKDLVLAQKTSVTVSEIKDLWRANVIERDEADEVLDPCTDWGPELIAMLKVRYRADATFANLMGLTAQLGSLRQERKNLVLVTNLLPRWREDRQLFESLTNARGGSVPRTGIERGRITNDNREIVTNARAGAGNLTGCIGEGQRLSLMDFEPRYRDLIDAARRENVSFYVITPGGLQAPPALSQQRAMRAAYDDLKSLADETGGIAVTDTNDLDAGFRRIADDLAAYYVLGYYTTNTKFDGGLRKISVKMKGKAIRARREYRAPTEAEIAAMANPAPAAASVETGPPAVIGEPTAYRVSRAEGAQKVWPLEFVRGDRLRVEWPVLAPLDRREARLLDSTGKPLPIDLPVVENGTAKTVVVELALAPFSRGTYAVELTAGSGGATERRRLTFMMK
jgi:VWFA-related protein